VGLNSQPWAWLLFTHSGFKPVHDFFGLPNVEIGFLECPSKASGHLPKFFFVEFPFVLEKAEGAEDSP
jgi:hypothetical protein